MFINFNLDMMHSSKVWTHLTDRSIPGKHLAVPLTLVRVENVVCRSLSFVEANLQYPGHMLRRDLVVIVPGILQGEALPNPIALFCQDLARLGVVEALLPKKRALTNITLHHYC